jgi:ribosomal protein L32
MDNFGLLDVYHVPRTCKQCGGVMVFKGVGEYHCEDCGSVDYDDYGKVRGYLEQNKGANAVEVEQATGVTQKTIRQMLRESRLQVAETSQAFLHCEVCGLAIRSGRMCPKCEMQTHRNVEEQERRKRSLQGFAKEIKAEDGQRRFTRSSDR